MCVLYAPGAEFLQGGLFYNMPAVISCVMPVHNAKAYLSAAVESVLAQNYPYFELILVDDGSTDGSSALCGEFSLKDDRVKLLSQPNRGAAAARNAAAQLSGSLRRDFQAVTDALLDIATRFYAVVDYPDEDIQDVRPEEIAAALRSAAGRLERLLDTCRRGQVLKSGVRTAIVGRPNAGKSSLLNALAGYERAIVTDIPGTTRDTVEESVLCGGVLLRLIDTAGIRATEDPVEQLGVERSRRAIASAELVLAVVDGAVPEDPEEGSLLADVARCGVPWLLVFTKRDMAGGLRTAGAVFPAGEGPLAPPAAVVSLSSVTGEGLEDLGNAVAALFPAGDPGEAGSLLTDRRQEDAARRALDAVRRALEALETGMTPDAVLTDAEEALDALGELTGRTAKEEIVSRIFSRFCVGK